MEHTDVNDDFYLGETQNRAIKRIRAFLRAPGLPSGGVLLVTGPRGVGKTRLVDHALCDRRIVKWAKFKPATGIFARIGKGIRWLRSQLAYHLLAPLSGCDRHRVRRQLTREPRGTDRLLLPVPVDPFFPEAPNQKPPGGSTGSRRAPSPESMEMDRDALALIRNLLFGLTSAFDARFGPRRFGRTLGAWLGWWTLWFTPTALLRPRGSPHCLWVLFCIALGFLAGGLAVVMVQLMTFCPPPPDLATLLDLALALPSATLVAWIILRFLDLRGLRLMGGQLYDLIHAQSVRKEVQMELEQSWRATAKGRDLLRGLGLLAMAVAGILWFGPEIGKPVNSAAQGSPELGLAPLLLAAAAVMTLGISGLSRQRRHASFGAENRVWMITLLRRYLYQLHRVGFEPVLVVDEIDKLEHKKPSENEGKPEAQAWPLTELKRFERTLWRMKQSLGAEFLWILIDSGRLIEQVIFDRRQDGDQGQLGTLVQDEVLIGPVPYAEFEEYAKVRLGTDWAKHEHQVHHWWLIAGGMFFELRRLVNEARESLVSVPKEDKDSQAKAGMLVEAIRYLTQYDLKEVSNWAVSTAPMQKSLRELLAHSEWHRSLVLLGMTGFARRLYDPRLILPSYETFEKEFKAKIPLDEGGADNTESLQAIGGLALYALLAQTYRNGPPKPDLKIERENGIDESDGRIERSRRIRLKVKGMHSGPKPDTNNSITPTQAAS